MRVGVLIGLSALGLGACGGGGGGYADRADLVAEPGACGERRFEIYFEEGQARLTEPAREIIGMTSTQLAGCDIRRVRVTGLASATGSASANQSLSERRAMAVAEAFEGAGWPAPAFHMEAVGDQGATTADGRAEPLRRRTEVWVEAAPL